MAHKKRVSVTKNSHKIFGFLQPLVIIPPLLATKEATKTIISFNTRVVQTQINHAAAQQEKAQRRQDYQQSHSGELVKDVAGMIMAFGICAVLLIGIVLLIVGDYQVIGVLVLMFGWWPFYGIYRYLNAFGTLIDNSATIVNLLRQMNDRDLEREMTNNAVTPASMPVEDLADNDDIPWD